MPPEFMDMMKNLEDNLKAQGVDPEKLAEDPEGLGKMLEQMMGGSGAEMQGMMQSMMQSMMSAEVLAEPIKKLKDLFPPWFAKNADGLSEDELRNYKAQYKVVQKLVAHFESEPTNVEKTGQLMQELQELGSPPAEIMKTLSPDMEFGADGQPVLPTGPNGEQCTVQ